MFFLSSIIIIILIIIYLTRKVSVKSVLNSKYYFVRPGKNQQLKADALAEISIKINVLLSKLSSEGNLFEKNIKLAKERFKEINLTENIDPSKTSYTVNKGEKVVICLGTGGKIYPINLLMYVALHELAHIGCESVGHQEEFINFFEFLVKTAVKENIYSFEDYSKYPTEYCGMTIKSNVFTQ